MGVAVTAVLLAIGGLLSLAWLGFHRLFYLPGPAMTVRGVPLIPMSLAREAAVYNDIKPSILLSWKPGKRQILIENRERFLCVHAPGVCPNPLMNAAARVNSTGGASYEPVQGNWVVFFKDHDGDEKYQLYRYDLGAKQTVRLTDGNSRNYGGHWSHSGDRYAYTSNERNGRDDDICVVYPLDPNSRCILKQTTGLWSVSDWSPDDSSLLTRESLGNDQSRLWKLDLLTKQMTLVSPDKGVCSGGEFTRDGKSILFTADNGGEFRRLYRYDIASGKMAPITDLVPWDVASFDLSDDGQLLAYTVNQDGISVLHLRNEWIGQEYAPPKLPICLISGLSWRPKSHELGMNVSASDQPSDVYSYNADTSALERWSVGLDGRMQGESPVSPQPVHWRSFDGRSLSAFLYRPDPKLFPGKRPVIIDVHGGPASQSRPSYLYWSLYYPNHLGVALVYPNIRGSTGYGKTFLTLDDGRHREDAVRDIGTLLDWIATQPDLDSRRVMIRGASYGGYISLAAAARYPERITCAVDQYGISDLATLLDHDLPGNLAYNRLEYGDERDPEMRAWMERMAPLHNADKISKPLMIIHGLNDSRVPYSEAVQMTERVRRNGVPVWTLTAANEGHGFKNHYGNILYEFCAEIEFVRRYLLK